MMGIQLAEMDVLPLARMRVLEIRLMEPVHGINSRLQAQIMASWDGDILVLSLEQAQSPQLDVKLLDGFGLLQSSQEQQS